MAELGRDLKFSFRQLLSHPGFTVIAVLVLGLGIGAATAIFSVLDTLVIRELPYGDAERIVTIWENNRESGLQRDDVAPANFLDWREQATSFEAIAALDPYSMDLTGGEEPEVVFTARVTEGFFRAMGAAPLHGRTLRPEDFGEGGSRVVVLSHSLWQRRFGSDPEVIGQAVEMDGEPYTIVGILPPTFDPYLLPTVSEREAWVPLMLQGWEEQTRGSRWWNVVAKLRPDVTLTQARAEMETISSRLASDYPETNSSIRANVVPLRDHLIGGSRTTLFILQGAVGFLLLIACANVASLLLARGSERQREFAIRSALGAGRARLMRQLLTESALLALFGGALGGIVAYWGVDLIAALGPQDLPRLDEVGVDLRVLGFALGLSGVTSLAFGIVPSLHLSRPELQSSMKEGRTTTAGRSRQRIRSGMVVAEVALSLVLTVGAGLLARSLTTLLDVDPGFERGQVAVAQVFRYADEESPPERAQFFERTLERIRGLLGLEPAGAVSAFPLIEANIDIQSSFHVEGRAEPRPEETPSAFIAQATVDYFRTMGIPLLEGRSFTRADGADAPRVAIVTQSLARRYWPRESPVGRRVRIGPPPEEGEPIYREIVGVVGQVRHEGLDDEPRPELFLPHPQAPAGGMTFVARTRGDAAAFIEPIKQAVWALDPRQAFYRTATLEELVGKSVAAERFNLWLFGSFAGIALLLAAVGIYGVVSYTTRARAHEFGVRMALGAGRRDVLARVMGKGLGLTAIGVGIGLVGSLGLTRLLSSLLFGVGERDPLTFVAVALLLVAVAMIATFVPARRATAVDPAIALRVE